MINWPENSISPQYTKTKVSLNHLYSSYTSQHNNGKV